MSTQEQNVHENDATDDNSLDTGENSGYGEDNSGVDPQVEQQARSLGWKPEEEYSGDPAKWTDAEAFLKVHERNNGALRKANERLAAEMAEMRKNQDNLTAAQKQIFDYQLKKAKEDFDNKLAFLKASRREALREGNHDLAEELEEQIDQTKDQGPEFAAQAKKTEQAADPANYDWRDNPTLAAFQEKHSAWLDKHEDATDFFIGKARRLKANDKNINTQDLLEKSLEATQRAFPQVFGATSRRSTVEGATPDTTNETTRSKTRSYANLPKEAREMCDSFVRDRVMTREDYTKMFFDAEDNAKARG